MRSRGLARGARAVALVVLVVTAALAGVIAPAAATPGGSSSSDGSGGSPPAGMVGVSDKNVRTATDPGQSLPVQANALQGGAVYTEKHAGTLEVTLTTASHASAVMGPNAKANPSARAGAASSPVLVLADDTNHAGRPVAVEASVLRELYGYLPEMAYGVHSSGEPWEQPISYDDGYAVFEVPRFSSNTIAFEGEFEYRASPATDGSSVQYGLQDVDAADNFSIDLTGHIASETDTVTASSVGDGGTVGLDVAGNLDPTNASVAFTGHRTETARTETGSTGLGGASASISITGNRDPLGPGGSGDPELTLTGNYDEQSNSNGGGLPVTRTYSGMTGELGTVSVTVAIQVADSCRSYNFDVYVNGSWHNNVGGASHCKNWDTASKTSTATINEPTNGNDVEIRVETSDNNINYESSWVRYNTPQNVDVSTDTGQSVTFGDFNPGQSKMMTVNAGADTSTLTFSGTGKSAGWSFNYTDVEQTDSPGLDVDGDGVPDASVSGYLADGETVTRTFSGLSLSDETGTVSLGGGTVDVEVTYDERTQTEDAGIEVNGQWTNHSGVLADGSTTTLAGNESWLQAGTNRVNVSVGGGSLSADAPTPAVELVYSHTATNRKSVAYAAEEWTDRYNVSEQYQSERVAASMEIPFEHNVVQLRDLAVRINESGGWSTIASANYDLSGNDLTVDLDAVYGGTIPAGTTFEVRTNGSKVKTHNMTLTVVEATPYGETLDSKIEFDAVGSNAYLDVGPTRNGDRLHYLYSESWSSPAEYVIVTGGGEQQLYAPGASAGAVARVTHLETQAIVETGDVKIHVQQGGENPELDIDPGPAGAGDAVTYKHYATTSGVEYILYSLTNGIQHAIAEAQSPVALVDDDSDEDLVIKTDDANTSSSDGGSDDSGPIRDRIPGQFQQESGGVNWPVLAGTLVVVLGGLYLGGRALRSRVGSRSSARSTASGRGVSSRLNRALLGFVRGVSTGAEALTKRPKVAAAVGVLAALAAVLTGALPLPAGTGVVLLVTGVPVVTYVGLRRLDSYSPLVFGTVSLISVVLGLQLLGGDLVGTIFGSEQFQQFLPILGLAALYVAYKGVQAVRAPESTTELVVQAARRGGDS